MGERVVDGRRYSWDDAKRRLVRRNHGVDLAALPDAFGRPTIEIEVQSDPRDGWRFKILGLAAHVVVVVYTEANEFSDIRLVTAWKANKAEQSLYYREIFGESY